MGKRNNYYNWKQPKNMKFLFNTEELLQMQGILQDDIKLEDFTR